jgi:hypothetical protein
LCLENVDVVRQAIKMNQHLSQAVDAVFHVSVAMVMFL